MQLSEELQSLFRNLTRLTLNVREAKLLLLSLLEKSEINTLFICSEFVHGKFTLMFYERRCRSERDEFKQQLDLIILLSLSLSN